MSSDNKYNCSPEEIEVIYHRIVAERSVAQLAEFGALRREVQILLSKAVACTPVPVEQTAMVEDAISQRPYLQQQLGKVYSAEGADTLAQLFDHPVIRIAPSALQAWFEKV